jgi:hypothetical protein
MKKLLAYLFIITGLSGPLCAQLPAFNWVAGVGEQTITALSSVRGLASAIDVSGNVYTTGYFSGSIDFDPAPGAGNVAVETAAGSGTDIFVSKFDNNGVFQWVKVIPNTTGDDEGLGITVAFSWVYVVGSISTNPSQTLNLDPAASSAGTVVAQGQKDAFLLKLTTNGVFSSTKILGGTGNDIANDCAISGTTLCVTGLFEGLAKTNLPLGPQNFTSAGSSDIFIWRLDALTSNYLGEYQMGGSGADVGTGIALDASNNIYTTGYFSGIADFNPGGGTNTLTSNGSSDVFISKLTSLGGFAEARSLGGSGVDRAGDIALNTAGEAFVTGFFNGTVDLDPTATVSNSTATGGQDVFVTGVNLTTGIFVWGKSFGTSSNEIGYQLKFDASNDLYVTGIFGGLMDADPGAGIVNLPFNGGTDVFVSKFSGATGNLIWARGFGGGSGDDVRGLNVSPSTKEVYLTGFYGIGSIDFDPNISSAILAGSASAGYFTQFITKWGICPTVTLNVAPINAICNGLLGGASVTATGGANITYTWSTGAITPSISNVIPGTFTVNASNACYELTTQTVVITQPSPITLVTTSTQSVCASQSLSIGANASGGTGAIAYSWQPANGLNVVNAASVISTPSFPIIYTVTASDANGCNTSGTIFLSINSPKNISGTVTNTAGIVNGNVILYKYSPVLSKWDSITTVLVNASSYSFAAVQSNSYAVLCVPTNTNLQTTYGASSTSWKNATIINHGCVNNATQNILVQALGTLAPGPGQLMGKIIEGIGYGQRTFGNAAPGNPIGGIIVKGGTNPGATTRVQTTTDANGTYTLEGLPLNAAGESYYISVEIPGLDSNGTYHKIIASGTSTFTNLDFVVDSAKITPVVAVDLIETNLHKIPISVYPNPANDILNVDYSLLQNTNVEITLMNILGEKVKTFLISTLQNSEHHKNNFDITRLNAGVYLLQIKFNNTYRTIKVVINK